MKLFLKLVLVTVLILGALAAVLPASAMPMKTDHTKSESELIQDLAPSNSDRVITDAMTQLERLNRQSPSVTNAIPALKGLLPDERSAVRRKAARILGIFHAQLTDAEIKLVCRQLQAADWGEVQSGVKSLRDLGAMSAVPDLLPLLHHSNSSVVRDTCRTLAVLADKSVIPDLEPLLKDPKKSVARDARDAIAKLQAKS